MSADTSLDLVAHLRRQRAWSDQTFGPGERTAIEHVRIEEYQRQFLNQPATSDQRPATSSLDPDLHESDVLRYVHATCTQGGVSHE